MPKADTPGGEAPRPAPGDTFDLAALDRVRSRFVGMPDEFPQLAPDPVNQPMIRHWCMALGDKNPVYLDESAARAAGYATVIAPPGSLQVWTMPGIGGRALDGVVADSHLALEELGFTSVVATECEHEYFRDLTVGTVLSCRRSVESISDVKKTSLGYGVFVRARADYVDETGALVGSMYITSLKFAPVAAR